MCAFKDAEAARRCAAAGLVAHRKGWKFFAAAHGRHDTALGSPRATIADTQTQAGGVDQATAVLGPLDTDETQRS